MTPRQLYLPLMRRFRTAAMRRFARLFEITGSTRILDVGGLEYNWSLLPVRPRVTMVNLDPRCHVVADGRFLPFRDRAFDIVFSNSVIEHVGGSESQRQFANECRRVGRRYFVRTPNKWFPI